LEHGDAVDTRHNHVEQDEVCAELGELLEPFEPVGGLLDRVALEFE